MQKLKKYLHILKKAVSLCCSNDQSELKPPNAMTAKAAKINADNFYISTEATFKGLPVDTALKIMDAYKVSRRKKNCTSFEVDGITYDVIFESEKKSAYFRSRGFSFYFVERGKKEVIRVSDHWSASQYNRSQKLNCGRIASCRWNMDKKAEQFCYYIPGEKYASYLIAGVCKFSKFTILQDAE